MEALLSALGFFLVLEGLFPLISPGGWKRYLQAALQAPEDAIRLTAAVCVVLGLVLVWSA